MSRSIQLEIKMLCILRPAVRPAWTHCVVPKQHIVGLNLFVGRCLFAGIWPNSMFFFILISQQNSIGPVLLTNNGKKAKSAYIHCKTADIVQMAIEFSECTLLVPTCTTESLFTARELNWTELNSSSRPIFITAKQWQVYSWRWRARNQRTRLVASSVDGFRST